MFMAAMQTINPGVCLPGAPGTSALMAMLPGALLFVVAAALMSVVMGTPDRARRAPGSRRGTGARPSAGSSTFMVGNPVMPLVVIAAVVGLRHGRLRLFRRQQQRRGILRRDRARAGHRLCPRARQPVLEEMDALVPQAEESC
jgi:multidrug efflux pump